ncbi:TadE/TadG family type IV pilus assembly protein [Botrimarina mediterranea]|uniref:TadE-like protein n=1 Tax=Botrimarina mediterranea TaxID=2528022 RepID=A0A518K6C4_9BACT|nr:TadE/TadG family type IV pilus assembly protein [Botrimarina mediterranea]QDV73345.1 TadE-like protein [Botrimarina mediterranea]QDV77862.1 TadE-like protein [Planctomycetes bacterium K2D]
MFPLKLPATRTRRRHASLLRRGVVAVEFAFCASIVFFFFLTMIEVARFHIVRHSLDQAVYAGARVGIVPGATAADVNQSVTERLAMAGVVGATITVTPPVINTSTQAVTVHVAAPYNENSWTLPKFFSGVDVVAEMTLDHENVAFN